MFCENCGKEMQPGDKFCMTCGWKAPTEGEAPSAGAKPAEAQAAEAKPAEASSAEAKPAEAPSAEAKPKKKKKGAFIAAGVAAVLGVAGIAAAFNWSAVKNMAVKTFSSAADYYQYVEQENVDAAVATAATAYNAYLLEPLSSISEKYQSYVDGTLKGEDIGFSGEVTLTLGELGQKAIKDASPEVYEELELQKANSVTAYYELAQSEGWMQALLGVGFQDTRFLSLDSYMDGEDNTIYVGIPELSEKYLSVKMADVVPNWEEYEEAAKANMQKATVYVELLEKIAAKLPDEKQAKKMMEKYGKLLLGCLNDVERKSGVNLEAGNVSQKCTKLDVTIDGKTLAKIAEKLCDELKDDKDFKKIFIGVVEELADAYKSMDLDDYFYDYGILDMDAETLYEAFRSGCKSLSENADALEDVEFELVMSVYVDNKGTIRGRALKFEYDEVKCQVQVVNPQNGKETGSKIEVAVTVENGETAKVILEGSYKESSGKLDGEFVLTAKSNDEKMDLWAVTMKKVDKASMEKGYLNGSFSLKLSEDFLRMAYGDGGSAVTDRLAAMELCLDVASSKDESRCELKLMEDGGLWGSIAVSGRTEKGKKVSAPSNLIQIKDLLSTEERLEEYWDSIDWKGYRKKMQEAGAPQYWLDGVDLIDDLSFEEFFWMLYN